MPSTLPSRRLVVIQRTALAMLLASGVINFADRIALSLANPLIRHDMGLSISQIGWLLSAMLWAYAFAQLPVGVMIDRIGPRWLLGSGLLVWSAAQAAAGFVGSVGQFVVLRMLLGIGEAPQYPTGARVVRDWFGAARRGVATGVFNCTSTLGPAIAPPVLTLVMLRYGWRRMFVLLGVLGIFMGLVWITIYRDRGRVALTADERAHLAEDEAPATASPVTFREWRALFRHRTTWGMICGAFGEGYVFWFYAAWLPGYLEIQRHISIPHVGWLASIPYLAGMVGSLCGGWTADALARRGLSLVDSRRYPIIFGMLGSAALTAAAARIDSNGGAVLCMTAAVFFTNVAGASIWGLAVVAAPAKAVASLGSIQNFGTYLGGAIAPAVTGITVQAAGSFTPALLVAALVGVSSSVIYLAVVHRPVVLEV